MPTGTENDIGSLCSRSRRHDARHRADWKARCHLLSRREGASAQRRWTSVKSGSVDPEYTRRDNCLKCHRNGHPAGMRALSASALSPTWVFASLRDANTKQKQAAFGWKACAPTPRPGWAATACPPSFPTASCPDLNFFFVSVLFSCAGLESAMCVCYKRLSRLAQAWAGREAPSSVLAFAQMGQENDSTAPRQSCLTLGGARLTGMDGFSGRNPE